MAIANYVMDGVGPSNTIAFFTLDGLTTNNPAPGGTGKVSVQSAAIKFGNAKGSGEHPIRLGRF